ncbi:MAG: FKBP-type peptidyl-prolyl cis-trans isomerase [Elusimicrobia bacterium]|nr:FKBP-type peptidyl-prolyl cis-trans isomerase [Elusimicrobiota bacterium]
MKLALISLILAAAPVFAADAPKAAAPKAAAPKSEAKKPAAAAASKDPFKTDDERAIYTIGFLMGRNVASFSMTPAEVKVIQAGLGDAIMSAPPKVDVRFYQPRVNELLTKRLEAAASKEKEKGRAYTEKFVKESKPQAIPGGGWYLETKAGTGPMPTQADTIKAHYRGTTTEGVEFDSSYSRGAPSEFPLAPGGVIECWSNGIPMMKVGGKAKLVCPSDVAYKDPGRPGIKPGATLVFEVELVEIVKPEAPKK